MNEFIAIGPREQDFFFTNNFLVDQLHCMEVVKMEI